MSSNTYGGGYPPSGPLGRAGRGEPPILAEYPDEPQYDLATVVQLVGVRPMTLWAWEQQLNVPKPQRVGDGTGGTVRHYSERDLVASIWLRDQILAGLSPAEAADRLMAAQPPQADTPGPGRPAGASDAGGLAYGGQRRTRRFPLVKRLTCACAVAAMPIAMWWPLG